MARNTPELPYWVQTTVIAEQPSGSRAVRNLEVARYSITAICVYCMHEWVSEWVGFNVPINTLQVISETSLSSQHNTQVTQNNTTQKVALVNSTTDTLKTSRLRDRTDRAWFSRLVRHTRKRSGCKLTTPEPARGVYACLFVDFYFLFILFYESVWSVRNKQRNK